MRVGTVYALFRSFGADSSVKRGEQWGHTQALASDFSAVVQNQLSSGLFFLRSSVWP